jgi:hypothetical protein
MPRWWSRGFEPPVLFGLFPLPLLGQAAVEESRTGPAIRSASVGKDFTRAIERWEIEYGRDAGAPTGRSLQPHMRLAHSNLYWTGAGRAVPRVRFLLPISVKGGRLESRSRSGRPRGRSAKPEARLLADARRELRRAWERGNNDQTGQ